MNKLSVCVLFGGMSPEHEVSLRSAESVLNNMNPEKYNIFPVGITKDGDWTNLSGSAFLSFPLCESFLFAVFKVVHQSLIAQCFVK